LTDVKRSLLALVMVAGLAGAQPALAQQPAAPAPAPAAQDGQSEFVPVSELPPQQELPAGPLVLAAYGFMWVAVLVYVFLLWRRLAVVQKDLDHLKRQSRS
jgi:CcmD family protein